MINLETIDKITFTANLVREYSCTPVVEQIGVFEQTMELFKEDSDIYFIEWVIPEAEECELIGIEVKDGTKIVTGYDGVFELPQEAIELLNKNGFNTDEVI